MTTVNGTIAIGGGIAPSGMYGEVAVVAPVFLAGGDYLLPQPQPIAVNALTGEWTVELAAVPEGYAYTFRFVRSDGKPDRRTVIVPDSGTYDYGELVDATVLPNPGYTEPTWIDDVKAFATAEADRAEAEADAAAASAAAAAAPTDAQVAALVPAASSSATSAAVKIAVQHEVVTPGTPTKASLDGTYETQAHAASTFVTPGSLRDQQKLAARNSLALRHFKLAMGGRPDAPVDVFCMGDSITAGYAVSRRSKRWSSILLDMLRSRYPTAGVAGGLGFVSSRAQGNSSVTYPDDPVSFSGGSQAGNPAFGLDLNARVLSAVSNSITWSFTGTGFDIDYTKYSGGGSFTWAVDGGAASAPIATTAGATNTGSNTVQIRGLTAGAHTVTATLSATGSVYINGGFAYNGDEAAGIRLTNLATLGWTTGNWWPTTAASRYWPASVAKRSPDLVFIALGANDFGSTGSGDGGTRTPAAYKANLKAIIAAYKANVTGYIPSFVLLPWWTIGTGITPLAPYADYVTAQYEVAAEDADNSVALFDFQQRINAGAAGTADGFLPDNTHPTDPGNRAIGEWIADLLAAA